MWLRTNCICECHMCMSLTEPVKQTNKNTYIWYNAIIDQISGCKEISQRAPLTIKPLHGSINTPISWSKFWTSLLLSPVYLCISYIHITVNLLIHYVSLFLTQESSRMTAKTPHFPCTCWRELAVGQHKHTWQWNCIHISQHPGTDSSV